MAYYIYAIIETDERLDFGPIGLGERPVYTLGPDGLKCVVSDAHLTEYIANTLNLGEHERVLEKVMQGHTILPMSFGSVASDEKEIILADPCNGNDFTIPWYELRKRWRNGNNTSQGWLVVIGRESVNM